MPELSIIILTYNSSRFIKSCLDAVYTQDYQDFEVILVDNGSKDDTLSLIKEKHPSVKIIENQKNLGAARARNQAIGVAKGKWILTLDCDVILEKVFFTKVFKLIESLPSDVGMIQPKMLMTDKKTIYSCGIYLSPLSRRFYDIGKGEKDNGKFNKSKYIFGACSAAAIYNHWMLEETKEKTGYFDEGFFFLVEDVDLAWRAQRKGWKAIFYPDAVSFHIGNSSNINKKARQYLCFRNRYLMIGKNENFFGKIRLFALSFQYDIPRLFYLLFTNKYLWK